MFAHPIAVAADIDHVTVMHEPVNEGASHDFVADNSALVVKALVGGEHGESAFITDIYQLKEQHRAIATADLRPFPNRGLCPCWAWARPELGSRATGKSYQ